MPAESTRIFVALRPCEPIDALVRGFKRRLLAAAGPQLYAADPPHTTLYLAEFAADRVAEVLHVAGQVAGAMEMPAVTIDGWQIFERDALTGLKTLVCRFNHETCDRLRRVQLHMVQALAPLRDMAATQRALLPRWPALSGQQRRRGTLFGFPYVGRGWIPHLTIASVRPSEWANVAQVFDLPNVGQVSNQSKKDSGQVFNLSYGSFTALDLFELHGLEPRLLATFPLAPRRIGKVA